MKTETKALLYDMDGLLLDTEWVHMRAYSELTRRLEKPQPAEAFKPFIGQSHLVTTRWLTEDLGFTQPDHELIAMEQAIYLQIVRSERPALLPGVREVFDLGDQMGFKRALVTSSEEIQVGPTMEVVIGHLERQGQWQSHFDVICTGESASRRKPAPDLYLLAVEKLGVPPQSCIALEDSPAGVTAAHAAGVRVMAIPNRYLTTDEVTQGRADYCYASLTEAFKKANEWTGHATRSCVCR